MWSAGLKELPEVLRATLLLGVLFEFLVRLLLLLVLRGVDLVRVPRGILYPFLPRVGRDVFFLQPVVEMTVFVLDVRFITLFPRPRWPLPSCCKRVLALARARRFMRWPVAFARRAAARLRFSPAITSSRIPAPVVNASLPTSFAKLAAPRFTKGIAVLNNPERIPPRP